MRRCLDLCTQIVQEVQHLDPAASCDLSDDLKSAAAEYHRPANHGVQFFHQAPAQEVVGQPHMHMAAELQVSL